MARRKKGQRRKRSPHPGIVIRKEQLTSGQYRYRARYTDPVSGKERRVSLDKLGLRDDAGRRDYCIRMSEDLAEMRASIKRNAGSRSGPRTIVEAVDEYLADCLNRLRPATVEAYQQSLSVFTSWCSSIPLEHVHDLTPALLVEFKTWLVGQPRRRVAKGKARGEKVTTTHRRKPASVNHQLRAVKTMLTHWRRLGLTPNLSSDDVKDRLANLRGDKPQPSFLRPAQIASLLEAALRHDRDVYKMTRAEKAGESPMGSTRKHASISPFLLFVLLSGCRVGEALSLRFESVFCNAPDENGTPTGEIKLEPGDTKTRHGRTLDLGVSPALRLLLQRLQLQSGDMTYIFGGEQPLSRNIIEAARKRLVRTYSAPSFSWQLLRSTCATYLTNAPGIFGAASAYRSSVQLGHSVVVAETRYTHLFRSISRDARSLEAAMQIQELVVQVLELTSTVQARERTA